MQALSEEHIQMRKAVIQNRVALDMLTAAQRRTSTIIKVECCVYVSDLSGSVSAALDGMKNQGKQCHMKTFLSGLWCYLR